MRAVLFDVGGPLDLEVASEALKDACIRDAFAGLGRYVSEVEYAAANAWAVESFASDAYAAITWRLAEADESLARDAYARFRELEVERRDGRHLFELRPGMPDLLAELHARGLSLGLAANQPATTLAVLDEAGIGYLFAHRELSGHHGFHKPDVRLFLRACEDLGVAPADCVMVGDRVDNDIVPAALLGMRTVLFRTGRHHNQQPRTWHERPDAEVTDVAGLRQVLLGWANGLTGTAR